MRWIFEDGVGLAVRGDADLLRQAMRAFHMLEPPNAWLLRPSTLLKVARVLLRGRAANAHLRPVAAGPPRSAMFAALGLEADVRPRGAPAAPASSSIRAAAAG